MDPMIVERPDLGREFQVGVGRTGRATVFARRSPEEPFTEFASEFPDESAAYDFIEQLEPPGSPDDDLH